MNISIETDEVWYYTDLYNIIKTNTTNFNDYFIKYGLFWWSWVMKYIGSHSNSNDLHIKCLKIN